LVSELLLTAETVDVSVVETLLSRCISLAHSQALSEYSNETKELIVSLMNSGLVKYKVSEFLEVRNDK
jgi:hypothetical protein